MNRPRIEDDLKNIQERCLLRDFRYLESAQMPRVTIRGRDALLFSSNNYLGLCNDERLKGSAKEAIGRQQRPKFPDTGEHFGKAAQVEG